MITIFENAIEAFRWTVVSLTSPSFTVRITKKNTEPEFCRPYTHRATGAPRSTRRQLLGIFTSWKGALSLSNRGLYNLMAS